MDETVAIATPEHVTLDFEIAGVGSRSAAMLIDLLFVVLLMIGLVLLLTLGGVAVGEAHSVVGALIVIILFLVFWGYFVFFETVMTGQTPGKRATGIRVIREDGLPIGLREAAIRNLVRVADMLPPPCYLLGMVVALADRRGRRLGDMAAGTIVIRERLVPLSDVGSGAAWAARVERGQSRNAVTLPRGTISASQLSVIEQFLQRRPDLPLDRRAALAWQIAEPILDLVGQDQNAIAALPHRGPICERVLAEVLEMSRDTRRIVASAPSAPGPGRERLF